MTNIAPSIRFTVTATKPDGSQSSFPLTAPTMASAVNHVARVLADDAELSAATTIQIAPTVDPTEPTGEEQEPTAGF